MCAPSNGHVTLLNPWPLTLHLDPSFFLHARSATLDLMTQSALVCGRCQAQALPEATFCHNCGSVLTPFSGESPASGAPWTLTDICKAIGLVVLVLIVSSIPASIVALVIAGGREIEQDPTALTVTLAASAFLELALLFTAVHFSVRKYHLPWASLGLRRPTRGGFWLTLGLAVGLVIAGLIVSFAYFEALSAVGIDPETDIEQAFQSVGPLVVLIILSLLFAPLLEEIFFRGFVFGGLRDRWGVVLAGLASGLLFALAHIGNPGTIYLIPPVAAIGAIFAWGYAYSGSLLASVLAHFLFNLAAVIDGISRHS